MAAREGLWGVTNPWREVSVKQDEYILEVCCTHCTYRKEKKKKEPRSLCPGSRGRRMREKEGSGGHPGEEFVKAVFPLACFLNVS